MATKEASGAEAPSRRTKTTLLTILGSVIAPLGISVWQETLVSALTALGASVPAARQGVARAVGDEWLTSHRVGRRARMSLTDQVHEDLAAGHKRALTFGQPREWNGEWLCVALSVPENSRAIRHHLRTELGWLGFGSLGNGVWVSPQPENEQRILRLLASNKGLGGGFVFRSARPASHTPPQLAAIGWDLDSLRSRYDKFIDDFAVSNPRTDAERFAAWVDLMTRWRHFPLFDPDLPERVLPSDWPRSRAYDLFQRRNEQWAEVAADFVRQLERDVTGA